MEYQVLARKWRPRSFQKMVGQEPILRMLTNALEQKRLHHAYLLTGTRGVGKTTAGRILAKCFNCETGITPAPCNTCTTCKAIDAGQFLDLFEVDAASRTKVEDTRDILDNVLYQPTQGRYKIYLIDEVHMLSNHSFNALLKTLEEPPAHVIFILATTDPKRLPITVVSRCLQFHLKRISPDQIAEHLKYICTEEKITFEYPALEKLAKAADGSMRDALSLLDQAIAFSKHHLTATDINAMLGCMAQDDLVPLLEALAAKDANALFASIEQLANHAPDYQQVLEELITAFHQIALVQLVPGIHTIEPTIESLAPAFKPDEIQLYYQIALLGRRDLGLTPNQQQGFEMTMLRLLAFQPGASKSTTQPPTPTTNTSSPKQPNPIASSSTTNESLPHWSTLLPQLALTGMSYALASNCSIQSFVHNKMTLALSAAHQPMLNDKLKERLTEALSNYFKKPISIEFVTTAEVLNTPAKQQQSEQQQQLSDAKKSILDDSNIKQLIEMYDATVEISLLS